VNPTALALAALPMLAAAAGSPAAGADPAGGDASPAPIAYWSFDQVRDGVASDCAGRHPGKLHGDDGLPEVVDGVYGKALRFEPGKGQYVRVDGMRELCPTDRLTVMAWIWVNSRTKMWGDIIGYQGEQGRGDRARPLRGFRLWKSWSCESIRFYLGDGETRPYGQELKCSANGLRRMRDHWMHVAATYDGRTMRVYVNAAERGASEVVARIAPAGWPLIIGNYLHRKTVYPFDGMIDEVRLYDAALTEQQILEAAAQPLQRGPEP